MKQPYFLISSLLILLSHNAHAAQFTSYHANSLMTHNIGAMQHSIIHTAMHMFSGTPTTPAPTAEFEQPTVDQYGQMPIYGTPPMYGEYDTFGFLGRSGGDTTNPVKNTWFTWNHFSDNVKFQDFDRMDSDQDLAMVAVGGGHLQSIKNSKWGAFAGYVGGTQETETINLDNNGGFFGGYSELGIGHFRLAASADIGMTQNKIASNDLSDKFTNVWAGGAIDLSYNIMLDDTFSLRPGLYVGYTWVQSKNYTSALNESIANKNSNIFEVAPGITAAKHIDDGWFGSMFVRYVYQNTDGGETKVNGTPISDLDIDNFTEYGISLEKSIDKFSLYGNIGRRDGGHDGWFGGLSLKYIF